jgi:hypothetical protein
MAVRGVPGEDCGGSRIEKTVRPSRGGRVWSLEINQFGCAEDPLSESYRNEERVEHKGEELQQNHLQIICYYTTSSSDLPAATGNQELGYTLTESV